MGNHRLGEGGEGRRCRDLHKGVHSLGHIGDGDGAIRLGGLCANDLAILQDIEHSAGEGVVAVIQFDELDLYLGVIFKDKGHIGFPVPDEGLLGLIDVRAFGIAFRRSDLFSGKAADGHILPGYVGQVAARAGNIGSGEIVVHAGDLDDRSGETLGGIVRVYLADAALAGDFRGIGEGNGHSLIDSVGQDNVLGAGVVDFVPLRSLQFSHGVSVRLQLGYCDRAVAACHHFLGVGAVFGSNEETCSG